MKENHEVINYHETRVYSPQPHDVLFGRGGSTNKHPGNCWFRSRVDSLRSRYDQSEKHEKMRLAERVVNMVHMRTPPGRFLEPDYETSMWKPVSRKMAVKKASQALRAKVFTKESLFNSGFVSGNEEDQSRYPMIGRQLAEASFQIESTSTKKRTLGNISPDVEQLEPLGLKHQKMLRIEECSDPVSSLYETNMLLHLLSELLRRKNASDSNPLTNNGASCFPNNFNMNGQQGTILQEEMDDMVRELPQTSTMQTSFVGNQLCPSLGNVFSITTNRLPIADRCENEVPVCNIGVDSVPPSYSDWWRSLSPPNFKRVPSSLYDCASMLLSGGKDAPLTREVNNCETVDLMGRSLAMTPSSGLPFAINPLSFPEKSCSTDKIGMPATRSQDADNPVVAPSLTRLTSQLSDWWQSLSAASVERIPSRLFDCASTFFSRSTSTSSAPVPSEIEMRNRAVKDMNSVDVTPLNALENQTIDKIPPLVSGSPPYDDECDSFGVSKGIPLPWFGRGRSDVSGDTRSICVKESNDSFPLFGRKPCGHLLSDDDDEDGNDW